jgi:hypothetical protein
MTSTDDQRPDDVPEGDYVEQHQLADGARDDDTVAPAVDVDEEADPADVQEQRTPAPLDDDDRR